MRFRLLLVFLIGVGITPAYANAAMGLALEIFEFRTWAVYVAAMIALEAWFIGRRQGLGWVVSVARSAAANLLTAVFCAGGLCAPLLHTSGIDPNPLAYSLIILTTYGAFSAIVEGILWGIRGKKSFLVPSLLAHAIGIPVALAILLIPAHPYVGVQHTTRFWRSHLRQVIVRKAIESSRTDSGFKPMRSVDDLLVRASGAIEDRQWATGDPHAAFYEPVYGRLSTGEQYEHPLSVEFNPKPIDEDKPDWVVKVHLVEPVGRIETYYTEGKLKFEPN